MDQNRDDGGNQISQTGISRESRKRYLENKERNWASEIHKTIEKYELDKLWNNPDQISNLEGVENWEDKSRKGHLRFWKKIVKQQIHKIEEIEWKKDMESRPKLRNYIKMKHKLELENYLLDNTNKLGTKFFTSLRVGTNPLRIEKGRWKGEKIEDRKCMICLNGEVEDEQHFMMKCNAYTDLRDSCFEKICNITKGSQIPYHYESFIKLLAGKSEGKVIEEIKYFIKRAMKRRERLI